MYRKKKRTDHNKQVAERDRKTLRDAQQVHPRNRNPNRQPDPPARTLAEQQPEQRYKQDIQRRNEPRLANAGVLDAELLEGACNSKENAAADPTNEQVPPRLRGAFARRFPVAQDENARDQHKPADDGTHRVKSERPDVVHARRLRNERYAPDHGGQQEHQAAPKR